MIWQTVSNAMQSFLTFFIYSTGLCRSGCKLVNIRSYISFSISINFDIIDYIGQLAKAVSFLHLAWLLLELDSSSMIYTRSLRGLKATLVELYLIRLWILGFVSNILIGTYFFIWVECFCCGC